MIPATNFVGQSGRAYSFAHAEDASLFPNTAGNFLYVRQDSEGRSVVFVGTSHDMLNGVRERWPEAVGVYGATSVFVRRIVSSRTRELEHEDLLERFRPVMNDETHAAPSTRRA